MFTSDRKKTQNNSDVTKCVADIILKVNTCLIIHHIQYF